MVNNEAILPSSDSFKELGINMYFFPLMSSENGSNLFHFLGGNLSRSFTECCNILKGKTKQNSVCYEVSTRLSMQTYCNTWTDEHHSFQSNPVAKLEIYSSDTGFEEKTCRMPLLELPLSL